MRSMAGLLSLLVGVCSVGAGVTRQEPSKWVVDLKAPLVNAHEETNERGQVLQLGDREISFRLTQPADSVVVEVLFTTYAGSGGPTNIRWHRSADGGAAKEECTQTAGISIWRRAYGFVHADSALRVTWDYTWDEKLIEEWQVASWGATVYGAGLTEPSILIANGRWVQIENYPLSCREWLPDPYHPQEIWGTWRHDERGRLVQGGYVIRTIAYAGGESESRVHMQPSLARLATENGIGEDEVVRRVLLEGREEFWGWYSIPGPGSGTLLSEMRWLLEQVGVDSLKRAHPWLDRNWDWRKGP